MKCDMICYVAQFIESKIARQHELQLTQPNMEERRIRARWVDVTVNRHHGNERGEAEADVGDDERLTQHQILFTRHKQ